MSIHTVGDSHSLYGFNTIPNVKIHHIGPVLCYSFGKEPLNRFNINTFELKDGDTLIFCFGEIDCRCHIHKYVKEEVSYQSIIDEIVRNYINAIEINIKKSAVNLKHVCIYNVVPTIEKHNTLENPLYPYLGLDTDRKNYVEYFNACLKQACDTKKWIFFDVYNSYADKNGFLDKSLSDGHVHISDEKYITKFIAENIA